MQHCSQYIQTYTMDLRCPVSLQNKRIEILKKRELSQSKRSKAQTLRLEARRKQRLEEKYDRKAEKAQTHSLELRRGREQALNIIQGYHQIIDHC